MVHPIAKGQTLLTKLILSKLQNNTEQYEIRRLMAGWGKAFFTSVAHCIVYHANEHGFPGRYLLYLRVASNFNKKRASKTERKDGTTIWVRSNHEFLIEHNGLVIVYGRNKP